MKNFKKIIGFCLLFTSICIGCKKNETKDQSLTPGGATQEFTYAPDATNSLKIAFTITGNTVGNSYQWQFGNGNSATGINPVHTYAAAGTYKASLTVTSKAGIYTITKDILVAAADFTLTASDPANPLTITVINNSINCTNFTWEWGNGAQSTAQNPGTYTFPTSGVYDVKLSAVLANSAINTSKTIRVFVASKAQLSGTLSNKWKYHPTQGLSFFGSFSNQLSCELNTEFVFFNSNVYQVNNFGSEVVFPNCSARPPRAATTYTLTRTSLLDYNLNVGPAGISFLGDPTTGPNYKLVNLTATLMEVDKVNFGFTDQVKYKFLKVP